MRGPKLGTKIENAKAIIENISTTGRENQRNPTVERNARDRSNISNQTVPTIGENTGIMNQLVCQRQRPRSLPPPPYYLLVSVIHKFDTHTRTHYVVSPPRFSNSSTLTRRFGVSSEISSRVESSDRPTASGKIENRRVGLNRKRRGGKALPRLSSRRWPLRWPTGTEFSRVAVNSRKIR